MSEHPTYLHDIDSEHSYQLRVETLFQEMKVGASESCDSSSNSIAHLAPGLKFWHSHLLLLSFLLDLYS